jgi:hypothetical protein
MAPSAAISGKGSSRAAGPIRQYFAATRAPRYSLLFALPLLLAYEALAAALAGPRASGQVRNGADVILKQLAAAAIGPYGPLVLMGAIIALSLWFVWRDTRRGGGVRPVLFAGMLVESSVLAVVFGLVIGTVTARLLGSMHLLMFADAQAGGIASMSWGTRLMLSLGAGLYEELLFRVLLVGALAAGARSFLGMGRRGAGILAAVVGALVFSAFHYIGRYGDPFQLQSFMFRTISGLAFSGMYLLRGFGITAWTHALYDVFLLLL